MSATDIAVPVEPTVEEFKVPLGLTSSDADRYRLLSLIEVGLDHGLDHQVVHLVVVLSTRPIPEPSGRTGAVDGLATAHRHGEGSGI